MEGLPRFIAIGHITNDLGNPEDGQPDLLGGGVSYSGVAARQLGHEVHIITKCPAGHPYISELADRGITVHPLPSALNTITTFQNRYDKEGRRTQLLPQLQEPISVRDLAPLSPDLFSNSIVLVASVVGEVDLAILAHLKTAKLLAITPQGYFRGIAQNGAVVAKPWEGLAQNNLMAHVMVLSDEDIALPSTTGNEQLQKLISSCHLVALTQGERGATLYEHGQETSVGAFHLRNEETRDFTGTGDTFATVFISELARGVASNEAAASAAFCAALKMTDPQGNRGLNSIPTLADIKSFADRNPDRVLAFLRQERLSSLSILESSRPPE